MKLFITDAIIAQIVSSSNSYRLSMKYTSYSAVSESEIWTFIAVILFMVINILPERNYLWGNGEFASADVKRHMSNRRFEQIMRIFHWIDTVKVPKAEQVINNKKDHFWRVREFIDAITVSFRMHYQCGQKIDIDERCIPFKGRHPSKCYNPNKPSKWHLKVYAPNDSATSYQINLLMYQGKDEKRDKDLTATEYPVHYLMDHDVFKNRSHILFCDNWYSSINIVLICLSWGIHFVGTIKTNRAQLPKEGRKEDNFTLLIFMRNLISEIFAVCCENNDKSEIDSGEDDEPLDDLYDLRGSYTRTSTLLSASNRLRGDHFPVQYEPRSGADGKDSRR